MLRTLIGIPGLSAGHQGLLEGYDAVSGRRGTGPYRTAQIPKWQLERQRKYGG